ncbi:MAG: cyclase family protein [Anaerolineaceae bacterium]|nr:cyclase family protein [Anaerolineaceae bacterium]
MAKIYDITLTITPDLPVWPGDEPIYLERVSRLEDGDTANVTNFKASVHAGTHIDAPCHFIDGARSVEQIPLDCLIGAAQVLEIPQDHDLITADVLQSAWIDNNATRILLKTKNSHCWKKRNKFWKDYIGVSPDGAEFLVKQGIKLLGIDYLSVAPFDDLITPHEILLKAGVVVLEGIDLSDVPAGYYQLFCLPLKLGGSDGAPARVILIEE